MLIDGVHFNNTDQGIRILSHGKGSLDRIIIKNVTGTYKSYGFFINPWINPQYKDDEKYGNFGSITIENVDLKQEGKKYDYTKPMLFRLGGMMDTLRLSKIHFVNTGDNSDFMQIGSDYIFFEEKGNDCKTHVKNLLLKDIEIEQGEGIQTRGIVVKESTVETMVINGLIANVTPLEVEGGKINKLYVLCSFIKFDFLEEF